MWDGIFTLHQDKFLTIHLSVCTACYHDGSGVDVNVIWILWKPIKNNNLTSSRDWIISCPKTSTYSRIFLIKNLHYYSVSILLDYQRVLWVIQFTCLPKIHSQPYYLSRPKISCQRQVLFRMLDNLTYNISKHLECLALTLSSHHCTGTVTWTSISCQHIALILPVYQMYLFTQHIYIYN